MLHTIEIRNGPGGVKTICNNANKKGKTLANDIVLKISQNARISFTQLDIILRL